MEIKTLSELNSGMKKTEEKICELDEEQPRSPKVDRREDNWKADSLLTH